MGSSAKDMNSFTARLATFEQPHPLAKRRASSTSSKKKAGHHVNHVEWPHHQPSKEALARAGFFYRPTHDSYDNVQCFLCTVKLDGWEESDDPISEHLAHSKGCAWATAISVTRDDDTEKPPEDRDPLSEEMYQARKATFQLGRGWPHEGKKGWKCKIAKLVDAGWCWDQAEGDEPDGVTCFYCALSLDGWEPKDDPLVEHKRREPHCPYFQLLERYHGAAEPPKKGKGRGAARGSTASKASRMSTQSTVTAASDAPSRVESLADIQVDSSLARVDHSIVTAATTTSTATAPKGKKKGGRTKAAAKGIKGRNQTTNEDVEMPDQDPAAVLSSRLEAEDEPAPPIPAKSTRRGKQQAADSSVVEISAIEAAFPKKATRGRKAKAQAEPEVDPEPEEVDPESEIEPEIAATPQTPDVNALKNKRLSEVSAQLQDELEHSVDNFGGDLDHSTPLAETPQPRRGVKRTSDGLRKQQEASAVEGVWPPAQHKPAAKSKRGKRAKQTSGASTDIEQELVAEVGFAFVPQRRIELELPASQGAGADDENPQPTKAKAASKKGKGKAKGKKASSAPSSNPTVTASEPGPEPALEQPDDDLGRDESEIEQELARMASERQAWEEEANPIQAEQDLAEEYEISPSEGRRSKDSGELQQLRQEIDAEREPEANAVGRGGGRAAPTPQRKSQMPGAFTPSPGGSDKENQPSSVVVQQPAAAHRAPAIITLISPTKATRVPLAASTPNRSPFKAILLSPSKQPQMGGLTSAAPWVGVDVDAVLLPSPQPSPGRMGEQLLAAAGALTSAEQTMSVEEWVRHRAAQAEDELKRKCESMVEAFERQGMRGLQSLDGIEVVAA